mgnify:CR=1 FL=1
MFELSTDELNNLGAEITTQEIRQQPELWEETFEIYENNKDEIEKFLNEIIEKHSKVRVIMTGAGSSAYVGESLLPYLKQHGNEKAFDFQAVATTNLVSNPKSYFKADFPTILISYARSGNSPESIASVDLGKKLVDDFYQITITCALEGQLAQNAEGDDTNFLLLMPERTNDQGFAMTGSFTCMTLSTALIFDKASIEDKQNYVTQMIELSNDVIARENEIEELLDTEFERVTYLGSGVHAGIAREVQLKILELTAGAKATQFDSSLGFRHGPKSFVNESSVVLVFVSNDAYTRQYDIDMLEELRLDEVANTVCAIQVDTDNNFKGITFSLDEKYADLPDAYLALPYTVFGQIVSLLTAVKVGNTPDDPSANKTVNRVVQGVAIHENLDK